MSGFWLYVPEPKCQCGGAAVLRVRGGKLEYQCRTCRKKGGQAATEVGASERWRARQRVSDVDLDG